MKVILKENVKNLGERGDLVDVADGYGRNFLIPKGLAIPATRANRKQLEHERRRQKQIAAAEEKEAEQLGQRLENITVTLKARSGQKGKLFGSVTAQDIAAALKEQHGVEIEKRDLVIDEPIKQLGTHQIEVKVYTGVSARITVKVEEEETEDEQV